MMKDVSTNKGNGEGQNDENMMSIEPERYAPSDLNIDFQMDLETKHESPLILREKVVIVGDDRVGKTSIINVLNSGIEASSERYKMTSTVELHLVNLKIPSTNVTVDLFLHDIPGSSIFHQVSFFLNNSIYCGKSNFPFIQSYFYFLSIEFNKDFEYYFWLSHY